MHYNFSSFVLFCLWSGTRLSMEPQVVELLPSPQMLCLLRLEVGLQYMNSWLTQALKPEYHLPPPSKPQNTYSKKIKNKTKSFTFSPENRKIQIDRITGSSLFESHKLTGVEFKKKKKRSRDTDFLKVNKQIIKLQQAFKDLDKRLLISVRGSRPCWNSRGLGHL